MPFPLRISSDFDAIYRLANAATFLTRFTSSLAAAVAVAALASGLPLVRVALTAQIVAGGGGVMKSWR